MGSRTGQVEVVHRGLSVYVVFRKLVAHSVIETERSSVDDLMCSHYLD